MNSLREDLLLCQLEGGVRLGCVDPKLLLKLDVFNAFNFIDRKTFIDEVASRYPFLCFLVNEAYSNLFTLFAVHLLQEVSNKVTLLVQHFLHWLSTKSPSVITCYLDDATIGGQISSVFNDAKKIIDAFDEIGLQINSNKYELLILNHSGDMYVNTVKLFSSILPSVSLPPSHSWSVLGSPLTHEL